MTDDEMLTALRAKGYRIQPPIDQNTCKHPRMRGQGSMSSNGASKSSGFCPDCLYSYEHETPGDPNYLEPISQN
jgi:hypothetical protein